MTKLLVRTSGNYTEWHEAWSRNPERPRLPLPFAFGAACAAVGFRLFALDSRQYRKSNDVLPFEFIYGSSESTRAFSETDYAVLWGTEGVLRCFRQAGRPWFRRQIVFLSYGWATIEDVSLSRRINLFVTRIAARFARCVVVMTQEQYVQALHILPGGPPIVRLRVGIDVQYYSAHSDENVIPEAFRFQVKDLLSEPYIILPGDELRLNDDAIQMVKDTNIRLVRISQYSDKSGTNLLKERIRQERLEERIFVFERISYGFLRFLLKHAVAYAGFVDSSWQPAGWTVACESLAAGIPLVIYDGLTARELMTLGIPDEVIRVVSRGDHIAMGRELMDFVNSPHKEKISAAALSFAREMLDMEKTGQAFGRELRFALIDNT